MATLNTSFEVSDIDFDSSDITEFLEYYSEQVDDTISEGNHDHAVKDRFEALGESSVDREAVLGWLESEYNIPATISNAGINFLTYVMAEINK